MIILYSIYGLTGDLARNVRP